jgi:hypothetical protein
MEIGAQGTMSTLSGLKGGLSKYNGRVVYPKPSENGDTWIVDLDEGLQGLVHASNILVAEAKICQQGKMFEKLTTSVQNGHNFSSVSPVA